MEVRVDDSGAVCAVVTATGAVFQVKAVVVATGTYLGGRTIVGDVFRDSGPDGLQAALELTGLPAESWAVTIRRFKTGTPPRVNARSVDFSKMELQDGGSENRCPSPSPPTVRRKIRRCAISPTPMRRPTTSSGRI